MNKLPAELVLEITAHIESPYDIRALRHAHPRLHGLLIPLNWRLIVSESKQKPLSWAARNGSLTMARLALRSGIHSINDVSSWRESTALADSIRENHMAVFDFLVKQPRCSLDIADLDGNTPLIWAAKLGYEAVAVRLLVLRRQQRRDNDGLRGNDDGVHAPWNREHHVALMWAAKRGMGELAEVLLLHARAFDHDIMDDQAQLSNYIDQKDLEGRTALSYAAQYGSEAVVKLLIKTQKVNITSQDNWPTTRTPLHYSVTSRGGSIGVTDLLLAHNPSDRYCTADSIRTLARLAAQYGQTKMVHHLLNRADEMDKVAGLGTTKPEPYTYDDTIPWKSASWAGRPTATNKQHMEGRIQQIFWIAAKHGHTEVIKSLLHRRGSEIEIDKKDEQGRTAFSRAVGTSSIELVRYLASHNRSQSSISGGVEVDIHSRDNGGYTPLYWAVFEGRFESVRFLLEEPAAVDGIEKRPDPFEFLPGENGHSAWQEALRRGDQAIIHLIGESSACPVGFYCGGYSYDFYYAAMVDSS